MRSSFCCFLPPTPFPPPNFIGWWPLGVYLLVVVVFVVLVALGVRLFVCLFVCLFCFVCF